MAADKGRFYLNYLKSQLREKLSLTSRGRDEEFSIIQGRTKATNNSASSSVRTRTNSSFVSILRSNGATSMQL